MAGGFVYKYNDYNTKACKMNRVCSSTKRPCRCSTYTPRYKRICLAILTYTHESIKSNTTTSEPTGRINTYMYYTWRETDRQIDRQTDRDSDRETETERERARERQKEGVMVKVN